VGTNLYRSGCIAIVFAKRQSRCGTLRFKVGDVSTRTTHTADYPLVTSPLVGEGRER